MDKRNKSGIDWKDPEQRNAYYRARYHAKSAEDKAKHQQMFKEWYMSDPAIQERIKLSRAAAMKRYYEANKEKHRQQMKDYHEANKVELNRKARARSAKRKAEQLLVDNRD